MARGSSLQDLVYMGMVGICDPPRPYVRDSIQTLLNSGIQVKLVTGDAQETAVAIGRQSFIAFLKQLQPFSSYIRTTLKTFLKLNASRRKTELLFVHFIGLFRSSGSTSHYILIHKYFLFNLLGTRPRVLCWS